MHQVAISTVDMFNGADLGIREEWVPLFDKSVRGGTTSIKVVYYDVVGPDGQLAPFETFKLYRPPRD
jgi:hypothetical protein